MELNAFRDATPRSYPLLELNGAFWLHRGPLSSRFGAQPVPARRPIGWLIRVFSPATMVSGRHPASIPPLIGGRKAGIVRSHHQIVQQMADIVPFMAWNAAVTVGPMMT
jgi:hypothetical protein